MAAEFEKYTASLVFLHGLWCVPSSWRRWMGYMAHRGWSSVAPAVTRADGVVWADWEAEIGRVVEACEVPPVIIGFDAGCLLALRHQRSAAALVLLSPRLPVRRRGLQAVEGWWEYLVHRRSTAVYPPQQMAGEDDFGLEKAGAWIAEPRSALATCPPVVGPAGAQVPTLLVSGVEDRVTSTRAAEQFATEIHGEFRTVEGGHGFPWGHHWQKHVNEVHRWIVQSLGESILLLDPNDPDEERSQH